MMDTRARLNKQEIDKIIETLKAIDYKTISVKELEQIINPILIGHSIKTAPLYPDDNNIIWRARKCKKPHCYSELIYPKPEFVTSYGRVNDIGQSMFYGTVGRSVPLVELNAEVGDTMVIGQWFTKKVILLNHVGYTSKVSETLKSDRNLQETYAFIKSTVASEDLNAYVYNTLADAFIMKVNQDCNDLYKLSIAISNKLISGDMFAGLMYPSIAVRGNSENIALKPEFVDECLDFVAVEFIEITSINGNEYRHELLDTASEINENNEIVWSGRKLNWTPSEQHSSIRNDGNYLYAKDSSGKNIKPKANGDIIIKSTPLKNLYENSTIGNLKVGETFTIEMGEDGFGRPMEIDTSYFVVYNSETKVKSLTFYLPDSNNCVLASKFLLSNTEKYLEEMNNFLVNPDYATYVFNNQITFYSEREYDINHVLSIKPESIILQFVFGNSI